MAVVAVIGLLGGGLGVAWYLAEHGAFSFVVPRDGVTFFLLAQNEPWTMALMGLILAILAWWLAEGGEPPKAVLKAWEQLLERPRFWVGAIAGLACTVAFIGRYTVYHDFTLSMDEYLAEYQAQIFATGQWRAPVPEAWWPLASSLTPHFVLYSPATHTWVTNYWPVHAALLTPFVMAGVPGLLNALFAGGSIWCIASVARRLWQSEGAGVAAALLLAASPQFLVTAMTSYAMPAHLFFNLVWIWLFLRGERWTLLLVPIVGLIALGLHKPNVHGLFVLPFCIRLVWQRRWGLAIWFAAVYTLGLWLCYRWAAITAPTGLPIGEGDGPANAGGILRLLNLPSLATLHLRFSTLPLLLAWQTVLTGALALTACLCWRRLPPLLRDLAWGALALWAFYFVGRYDQGHGWGYRYCHSILGNLVLLAVAGLHLWKERLGRARVATAAAVAVGIAWVWQMPLRCWQVEDFVRPYAEADEYLARQPGELLVIQAWDSWYARDLVRNRFDLSNRPIRLSTEKMTAQEAEYLKNRGGFRVVGAEELARFGVRPMGRGLARTRAASP